MLPTIPMMNINNGLDHNPFPRDLVYLQSIEDTIVVMKSLVQPKRISFRGTDGRLYSFLCKPKDDLRRDCRLLDFNNLLNKLFMKGNEFTTFVYVRIMSFRQGVKNDQFSVEF